MIFGASKPKPLEPKKMVAIIRYAAKHLPDGYEVPELGPITVSGGSRAYEIFLRRAYLDVEARVVARKTPDLPDARAIRERIRKHFRLEHALPTPFTVLFVPPSARLFFLLRSFLEGVWVEAGWTPQKIGSVIGDVVSRTPLAPIAVPSEGAWTEAFRQCLTIPEAQRENAILDFFRRVIARTYHEAVKERGESRANILFETRLREIEREYGMVEIITRILETLPPGILKEERFAFATREELAETVRRQMQELRGKNIALVSEAEALRKTIGALERAKQELQAMASAQQDFITVVSHQFRTPLAAIRWQGDALEDLASQQPDKPELKAAAAIVRERSMFLIGVLENIFDLLAIESGRFTLSRKRIAFDEMVGKLCSELAREADRRKLRMRCVSEVGEPLFIDANAIKRVLSILLTNAIGYSNEGGTIEVQAVWRAAAGGGREVLVSVRDEGIGFRQEDRPRIFEKFFRAKSAVEKVPDGAGVALYIAKRIVELHGGKMWAESKGIGTGATFFFTIPDRGDKEEAIAQALPTERPPEQAPAAIERTEQPPLAPEAASSSPDLHDPLLGI